MIKENFDYEYIKSKILSDEIFDLISPDDILKESVKDYEFTSKVWFDFILENEEKAGLIAVEKLNPCSIEIHPYLFPEFEKKGFGKKMMNEFFKFFLESASPEVIKINCKIAKCFNSTYKFAKKVGFIDEGVDRESFKKYGSVWDQNCLGITRKEIEEKYS
jgi:RimJ/RimL family protein N-acetyltransferase